MNGPTYAGSGAATLTGPLGVTRGYVSINQNGITVTTNIVINPFTGAKLSFTIPFP